MKSKKILYVMPKEIIELSCPNHLWPFMLLIWRYIKVKTVKLKNKSKIKTLTYYDEVANL